MPKEIPKDIRQVYNLLKSMIQELPDDFGYSAKELMQDLLAQVKVWYGGGTEPDWDGFRFEIDELCYESGEPFLFGAERGEYMRR